LEKRIFLSLDRGVWDYDLQEICKKSIELKLNGLEIQVEHPEIFKNFPELGEAKKILADFNLKTISIHGPIKDINISSYNPRIRKISLMELKDTVMFASKLSDNISYIVVHAGQNSFRTPSKYEKSYLPKAIEFTINALKELINVCEEHGITLSLENMSYSPWRLSSQIRYLDQIFAGLPSLKFTFDYAHGEYYTDRYSLRILKTYRNRLISVHIGDYKELEMIFNQIKNLNPYIIIEPHHLSITNNVFERIQQIVPKIRALS
jgi:sugar phosphate isomerase/epimerase